MCFLHNRSRLGVPHYTESAENLGREDLDKSMLVDVGELVLALLRYGVPVNLLLFD